MREAVKKVNEHQAINLMKHALVVQGRHAYAQKGKNDSKRGPTDENADLKLVQDRTEIYFFAFNTFYAG